MKQKTLREKADFFEKENQGLRKELDRITEKCEELIDEIGSLQRYIEEQDARIAFLERGNEKISG